MIPLGSVAICTTDIGQISERMIKINLTVTHISLSRVTSVHIYSPLRWRQSRSEDILKATNRPQRRTDWDELLMGHILPAHCLGSCNVIVLYVKSNTHIRRQSLCS